MASADFQRVYQGRGREMRDKITGGEDSYFDAHFSPNKWHFNSSGPFKWRVNPSGWVDIAKPAVLKVLGSIRYGWKEYRLEKDGMIKQVNFVDFMTKEEADKAFRALNSRACNAKFKVGDVVRLRTDGGKHKYKVVKVLPDADAESIMGGYLVQKMPPYDPSAHGLDKNIGSARSADMTLANSRACTSTNAIVRKAMNARIGRDLQDAGAVSTWVDMFRNFLDWHLPKSNDKQKARKNGETIIKYVEEATHSEGGKEQLRKMGWTVQRMRDALEKGLNAATARNAEDDWVERFEVGGVYHGPYMNKDWLAKVLSRTDSSIRVAIKSRRDKTWHGKDEQVTLRINKRQAEEDGTEVAKGYGWEFWANDFE